MQRMTGVTHKSIPVRILQTVLFKVGLLALLLPFIASSLGICLLHALLKDGAFALSYMVYAFAFSWAYNQISPCRLSRPPHAQAMS